MYFKGRHVRLLGKLKSDHAGLIDEAAVPAGLSSKAGAGVLGAVNKVGDGR